MSEIAMPRLSDTMEEGTILRWLKHDGEHVERGEELVEIETDKAAMTYEADTEGTLQIVAHEGDTLAVGVPIAHIGEAGVDTDAHRNGAIITQSTPTAPDASGQSAAGDEPRQSAPLAEQHPPPPAGDRVKASPLARRIARDTGVDLAVLSGSGPGGRIVKADVEAAETTTAAAAGARAPQLAPDAQPAPHTDAGTHTDGIASSKGETTAVELSRTQRTIARRMAESKATIPDFTLTADIDMERCVDLRAELKRLSQADAPTYNDMIVKACALALREYPRANGSYRDGRFELHSRVNVGVAVAVAAEDPTSGALVVPTVFDADTKALGEIARETRALAERVRDGSVTPPELSGGTFTVSNLGMYGIREFTAIVNPPQAAILAVGAVAPRAIVRKKKLVARQSMSLTLACDHRILYGADAALFLARVRELLEEPAALTL
ncbi:MAG TPA: dihydrolipoamide acetyltransferase family protein [Solirubrobacteraceae bacterium]|nr:dihydrolipoamide acetyltransferase family protein [Solirubrobacteraceae bacterium]